MDIRFVSKIARKLAREESLPAQYACLLAVYANNTMSDEAYEALRLWADDRLTEDFSLGNTTVGHEARECGGSVFTALCRADLLKMNYKDIHALPWISDGAPEFDLEAALKEIEGQTEE